MTPTDVEDRLRRDLAREAARTQADMLRPLAEPGRAPRRELTWGLAPRRARRGLAPAAAVAAVAAVLAGVALAGSGLGARPGPASNDAPPPAGLAAPRFYVSVSLPPHVRVTVHNAITGRVLASTPLPAFAQGAGPMPSIAAAANDRTFAIAATEHLPHSTLAVRLFEVSLSARGHVVSFASIANLTKPASAVTITGIALSPDGSQLAAAEEFPTTGFHPLGQIELVSLRTGHVTRTWPGSAGIPSDPAWAGPGKLGFLWWDRIRGPVDNFTARTRERLLNTAAAGSLLGSSKVIAAAPGGVFLQTAELATDGRVLLGTWYRNIPGAHGNGVAVVSFGQVGLRGHRPMVLEHRSIRFHGAIQEGRADSSCNVLSVAGRAPDALVQCPSLEKLQNGWIGTLPGIGPVPVVAW